MKILKDTNPTARFWVHHKGSFVKLSVAPGKRLTHEEGGQTDEGWSSYEQIWRNLGDEVTWGQYSDGADCDGRHSSDRVQLCPLDALKAFPAETEAATGFRPGLFRGPKHRAQYERLGYPGFRTDTRWTFTDGPLYQPVTMAFTKPGIVRLITSPPLPAWEDESARQRDYFAESMGY